MASQVYLIYIDESYDPASYAYSALMVPIFQWNSVFERIQKWRQSLQDRYDIPVHSELHATDFVSGRGQPKLNRDRGFRGEIFREAFTLIESMPELKVLNAFAANKIDHMKLFEWMLNRINKTLEANDACGILVCDEGNEKKLVAIVRTMKKSNSIPDSINRYGFNSQSRNLPISRIIEDPLFKKSQGSYLIQLADFLAYGLLRHERPTDTTHQNVQDAFNILNGCLIKIAFARDPKKKGIIRT